MHNVHGHSGHFVVRHTVTQQVLDAAGSNKY